MEMTKEDFKKRWEADELGGGINYNEIAECAVAWGIHSHPKTSDIFEVSYLVLKAANVEDAEEFHPDKMRS